MTDKEKTIKNLQMIIEELPKLADKMPCIREEFDMWGFGCYNRTGIRNPVCGTAGCFIGNIARLFDVSNPLYYDKNGRFDYDLFCMAEFPSVFTPKIWAFLFGARWKVIEPTFDQAIERAKYLLAHDFKVDGHQKFQKMMAI